jgi:hypothetical protein
MVRREDSRDWFQRKITRLIMQWRMLTRILTKDRFKYDFTLTYFRLSRQRVSNIERLMISSRMREMTIAAGITQMMSIMLMLWAWRTAMIVIWTTRKRSLNVETTRRLARLKIPSSGRTQLTS